MHCLHSRDPKDTLLGVTVALMYYGLLRSTDVRFSESTFLNYPGQMLQVTQGSSRTTTCFRRSAATNLADAGVSLVNLKRHGQWKSDTVAERYIANSVPLRQERATKLLPSHLRFAKLPPSLTNQWSSSSSEGSYDPPLENLRYASSEGSSARRLTLSPPAVGPPAVVSPAVARGTPENLTPARSAVRNPYKKPKQLAQKPPIWVLCSY